MVKPKSKRPGPKEARLKLGRDWEGAVGNALKKKRPKDGWPGGPKAKKRKLKHKAKKKK